MWDLVEEAAHSRGWDGIWHPIWDWTRPAWSTGGKGEIWAGDGRASLSPPYPVWAASSSPRFHLCLAIRMNYLAWRLFPGPSSTHRHWIWSPSIFTQPESPRELWKGSSPQQKWEAQLPGALLLVSRGREQDHLILVKWPGVIVIEQVKNALFRGKNKGTKKCSMTSSPSTLPKKLLLHCFCQFYQEYSFSVYITQK